MNRTFGQGNQTTWTFSCWIKRSSVDVYNVLFATRDSGNTTDCNILFEPSGEIRATRGANVLFMSEQVFVDPSAWYHIVWVTDTTLAEQDDRSKLYVNGERVEVNWSSSLSQGQTMSMNGPYTTYLG